MSSRFFDWQFIFDRIPVVACQRAIPFEVHVEEKAIGRWDHFTGTKKYYTTFMLENLISNVEVVDEWPACILTVTRENAERIQKKMIDMFVDRDIEIGSVQSGRITLKSGAQFNFLVKENMDRWIHGNHMLFSFILEDNEVYEHEHGQILKNARRDVEDTIGALSFYESLAPGSRWTGFNDD